MNSSFIGLKKVFMNLKIDHLMKGNIVMLGLNCLFVVIQEVLGSKTYPEYHTKVLITFH